MFYFIVRYILDFTFREDSTQTRHLTATDYHIEQILDKSPETSIHHFPAL